MHRLNSGLLAIVFAIGAVFYLGYLSGHADQAQRDCIAYSAHSQTGETQC